MTVFGIYGFLILVAVGSLFYLSNAWARNVWRVIVMGRPPDEIAPRSRKLVELYQEHLVSSSLSLRLLLLTIPLGLFLILEDLNAYTLEEFGASMNFLGLSISAVFGIFAFVVAVGSLFKETRAKRRLMGEKSRQQS